MRAQGPFVLLVEDDEQLRRIIGQSLTALGYLVFAASSFAEATELMAAKPHLMILDIGLPDRSGWDVAGWLEALTDPVPIVVISGQQPSNRQLRRFQPVAFLAKPFAIGELVSVVQEHIVA